MALTRWPWDRPLTFCSFDEIEAPQQRGGVVVVPRLEDGLHQVHVERDGLALIEAHVLGDEADPVLGRDLVRRHGMPEDLDVPTVRGDQAHDDPQDRGLAGAVGPDQSHHGPLLEGEVDVLQLEMRVALAEAFAAYGLAGVVHQSLSFIPRVS